MQLKTKELAQWLRLSPATVRLWTTEGYGEFLSPVGQGGDGRTRSFNEQDARIIAFIHALKQEGQDRDEIMATLKQLESEHWRDLPPMPAAPPGVVTETINLETAETALVTQRNAALREIAILEERIENLEGDLVQERLKRESIEAELRQELSKRRDEVTTLTGQLEAAKAQVTIIQQERQPAAYWLRVIVVIVAIAILLTIIISLVLNSG
jgi:DNA-binding transcriptional MerR regulator